MRVVTYNHARRNLGKLMDEVERDRALVCISRSRRRGAAVLMSLADHQAMQTTLYLLSNVTNANMLFDGIAELGAGKGVMRKEAFIRQRRSRTL
jgi:antitoxin YefM